MKHPSAEQLALFAGGDLPLFEGLAVRWHLRTCAACRFEVQEFRSASDEARAEFEPPASLAWESLAAEMKANIRVGLAAGECVSPARSHARLGWRPAAGVAAVTAVLMLAYWLNVPAWQTHKPSPTAVVTSTADIELNAGAGRIELLHPSTSTPVVYVSAPDSLRARSVDPDTGQITITNVYVD